MWGKETEGYREHAQVPLYCITLSAAARLPFQARRFGTMLYCATTGEAIIERGAAAAQTQKWTATVNMIYGGSLCGDVGLGKTLSVLTLCAYGRAMRWSWGAFRPPPPAPPTAGVGGGPARAPWEKKGAPPPPPPCKTPKAPERLLRREGIVHRKQRRRKTTQRKGRLGRRGSRLSCKVPLREKSPLQTKPASDRRGAKPLLRPPPLFHPFRKTWTHHFSRR